MKIDIQAILDPQVQAKINGLVSRGVKAAEVNSSGYLIFTLTDNSTVDLGSVIGPKGDKGDAGSLGSVTASVDANIGTPSVVVTYDGENADFAFHNLKGVQGAQGETGAKGDTGEQGPTGATGATGNGIASITKTATVGKVDTYTITFTDGTTTTFTVTNGQDGQGSGDMTKAVYDDDNAVANAGGIADYVEANGGKIDHIKVNGTEQTITSKTVDITVPIVDAAMSDSSTNTVQNAVIKSYVDSHHDSTKVDVVAGKGLSTNDYDNTEKGLVASAIQNPSTKSDGQALIYDATTQTWKAGNVSTDDEIEIGTTAPTDKDLWVDTSEGMIVDAGYVFGNVWDLTLLSTGWTAVTDGYSQTVTATGLDHHFVLLGWQDNPTDAQESAYSHFTDVKSDTDGTVTVISSVQPSIDVPLKVKYHESTEQKTFDDFVQKTTTVNGKALSSNIVVSSNRNLLDNPWFTVNQRGASGSTTGYGLDRWESGATGHTISGNTIVVASGQNFFQPIPYDEFTQFFGKKMTLSVMYSDNTIEYDTLTIPSSATSSWSFVGEGKLKMALSTNYCQWFRFESDDSYTIKAVKLELGEISTLHLDTAPNYAEELLKCQRYCYVKHIISNTILSGYTRADYVSANISFPTQMRVQPTLSTSGTSSFFIDLVGSYITSTNAPTGNGSFTGNSQNIKISTSSITAYRICTIEGNGDCDLYLIFSADL